jgi:hypothetical protein
MFDLVICLLVPQHATNTIAENTKPIYACGALRTIKIKAENIVPMILEMSVIVSNHISNILLAAMFNKLKKANDKPVPKNHNASGVNDL